MTPQEFIGGLRERGYSVIRMQEGPGVIIPRLDPDDPLCEWLSRDLGVKMVQYKTEQFSKPDAYAYEARLHTAAVVFTDPDIDPDDPKQRAARAMAIWEAAGA